MPSDGPSASGEMTPANMGRCDFCGELVDLEHSDDEFTVFPESDEWESENGEYDVDDFRDAVIRACEATSNVLDDELAEAFREKGYVKGHVDCLDETTMVFEEVETL